MFVLRVLGSIAAVAALAACQKVLSEAKMRPLDTLVGTEWGMADDEVDRFVAFKPGGEVVGNGGCNNFFGSFTQSGRVVTFGPLASTRKVCPDPVMQAERDWLDLLGRVRAVDATRLELRLFGEDGSELAVLRRRDWD
ncbi:MAG: META domain-containing protein [Litorimonas sp.]